MSTPFQNRLVGTIIVAAAAIIFLPDIFDGEKKAYQAQFEAVPPSPEKIAQQPITPFPDQKFEQLKHQEVITNDEADDQHLTENLANNKTTALQSSVKPVASHTVKSEPKIATKIKTAPVVIKPVPKSVDKSVSYVIQLGSFRHKENVAHLVKKLKKNNYIVFTKPIKTSAGSLTKVFIGPQFSKKELEKKLPKLKELTGVQGRIATFQPID